jgi:hypothetical protein
MGTKKKERKNTWADNAVAWATNIFIFWLKFTPYFFYVSWIVNQDQTKKNYPKRSKVTKEKSSQSTRWKDRQGRPCR